ncbi:MAG: c-type cytochrome, partial [Planctomycetota bacterium]
LTLGPDNAIWGSVGYANFTGADGKAWGSGLWRLLPDAREPEFVAQFTNNTWGLGMRPDGEVFGSTANGAPSFFVGAPKALLADTDANAPGAAPVYDTSLFHPALEVLHQGDFLGHYTAAAGHQFAFGPQMPANWAERSAFVCGPTGHLVGRFQTYTRGSGYESRDCFNLCVSLDDWFCPVQAEVGPDGAVWVADFAQFLILHNLPGNPERGLPKVDYGKGNAHMNPLRDTEHGRIFRIQRKGAPAKVADMSKADARGWMALLDSDNHFWREKARLHMGERIDRSLVPALLAVESPGSMQVLASWRQLENEEGLDLLRRSLTSGAPYLQKHALMLLPEITAAAELLAASNVLESANATVRRHALLAAARMPESPALGVALAARAMREDASDAWLGQALRAAVARHAASFLVAAEPLLPKETEGPPANLLANGNLENADPADASQPAHWRVRTYGGEAEHTWQAGAGRDGTRALVIRSSVGADTSWCTDVAVEPATRYRLSAWIHTTDLTHPGGTHGALLNIHPRHVVTEYVQDNQDWTEVSLEFLTGPDERSVSINCLYGGWGRSTGTAVYDDLRLISLGPALDLRSLVELARVKSGMESAPIEATADDALMAGGDAARGRDLFFNNATIACNRCHAWNGQGGGLGPDLVDVRKRLTRAKILESILDPGAALAESWTAPATVMPALRPFLSDQEVRDLVEFLAAGPRD